MFPSTNTPRGLLASDLDGTLAIDGIIPLDAFDAAEKLHNHGISVLIVTGRNAKSLQRVEGIWNIADEIIFSSGAGLLVHPHAVPLERTYFPKSEITAIRDILDKETEDYCILDRIPNNHYFQWKQSRKTEENPDFHARLNLYSPWSRPIDTKISEASQVLLIRPNTLGHPVHLLRRFSAWSAFYSFSPLDKQSIWLEVFPRGVNKGTALARRCRERNIDRKNTLALGNDYNDVPMLRWSANARVVANSPSPLLSRWNTLPPPSNGGFAAAAEEAIALFGRENKNVSRETFLEK